MVWSLGVLLLEAFAGSGFQKLQQLLINLIDTNGWQRVWCTRKLFDGTLLTKLDCSSSGCVNGNNLVVSPMQDLFYIHLESYRPLEGDY